MDRRLAAALRCQIAWLFRPWFHSPLFFDSHSLRSATMPATNTDMPAATRTKLSSDTQPEAACPECGKSQAQPSQRATRPLDALRYFGIPFLNLMATCFLQNWA